MLYYIVECVSMNVMNSWNTVGINIGTYVAQLTLYYTVDK